MMLDNGYRFSVNREEMQIDAIHASLTRSYWSEGISREIVARAIENSVCAGAFWGNEQVGFARVVTDKATFGYLADVYVLIDHRGVGLAKKLVQNLHDHPDLQGLRRWMLATRDAHMLYEQLGWTAVSNPEILMQRHFPDVYR